MSRNVSETWWEDRGLTSVGVIAADGYDLNAVADPLRGASRR